MDDRHKLSIAITLGLVEARLSDFEQWAEGREWRGAIYRERNDLTPEDREAILAEIRSIQEIIREIRAHFDLPERVEDVAKSIWASCWSLLEPITEMQGRYMRRYGDPSPELMDYLDPQADRLAECVQRISQIAAQARGRRAEAKKTES